MTAVLDRPRPWVYLARQSILNSSREAGVRMAAAPAADGCSMYDAFERRDSERVLAQLRAVCDAHGLPMLGQRLEDLAEFVRCDLETLEVELQQLPRKHSMVHRSANHLL